jgi:hypothetical protein
MSWEPPPNIKVRKKVESFEKKLALDEVAHPVSAGEKRYDEHHDGYWDVWFDWSGEYD